LGVFPTIFVVLDHFVIPLQGWLLSPETNVLLVGDFNPFQKY